MDLFSKDPKVLAQMADESIAHLKAELAKFDATQTPHYERLIAYAKEASEDGDYDASDDYQRQARKHFSRWMDARRPYLQNMQHIALAKLGLAPREITFNLAGTIFACVEHITPPA